MKWANRKSWTSNRKSLECENKRSSQENVRLQIFYWFSEKDPKTILCEPAHKTEPSRSQPSPKALSLECENEQPSKEMVDSSFFVILLQDWKPILCEPAHKTEPPKSQPSPLASSLVCENKQPSQENVRLQFFCWFSEKIGIPFCASLHTKTSHQDHNTLQRPRH